MDYEFDLEILGTKDPVIKRNIFIPGDRTFMQFHYVMQVLFNWKSYHYFCFSAHPDDTKNIIADLKYEEPVLDDEVIEDARLVKLKNIFGSSRFCVKRSM